MRTPSTALFVNFASFNLKRKYFSSRYVKFLQISGTAMNTKIALSVLCLLLVTLKKKVLHPPQNNCSLLVLEERTVPPLYELLNGNFADTSHTKLNLPLINLTTKNVFLPTDQNRSFMLRFFFHPNPLKRRSPVSLITKEYKKLRRDAKYELLLFTTFTQKTKNIKDLMISKTLNDAFTDLPTLC